MNVPPELRPLWERERGRFKGTPHQRVTRFLETAETDEGERAAIQAIEREAEGKLVRVLASRPSPRVELRVPVLKNGHRQAWLREQDEAQAARLGLKPARLARMSKPRETSPMAKKTKTRTAPSAAIVRMPPSKPQTIVVRQSAPAAKGKSKGGHRRGKGGGGDSMMTLLGEPALAGVVLGYINKNQPNFPTVPMLGRAGTLAAAAYFFRKQFPLARKLAPAWAAIAGYEWQMEGKIAGYGGEDTIAAQA